MTDDLIKLAERVEAATGPDRALDCDIALATGYSLVWPEVTERLGERRAWVGPNGERTGWREGDPHHPPCVTASIDAALLLVPEGWKRQVLDAENGDGICDLDNDTTDIGARAKTWPLAICTASLRALATDTGKEV